MNKLQPIQELLGRTMEELTGGAWPAFLRTAAWTFKYSFPDQLLIYAQRPDATACASIEVWNKRLNRTVKPNAAHIALLDDLGDEIKLRYVIDVADTEGPGQVPLWHLTDRNREYVYTAMAAGFNVSAVGKEEPQTHFFERIAQTAVESAAEQASLSLQRIQANCEGLSGLTPDFAESIMREILTASITATMMYRCGMEPDFSEKAADPFRNIGLFTDPRALSVLGQTTQALSRDALMVAAKAAQDWDRTHKEEIDHEHSVSQSRGVSYPGIDNGTDRTSDPLRQTAEEVSAGGAPERVHGHDADRTAADTPERAGADSADNVSGAAEQPAESKPGAEQGAERDSLDSTHDEPAQAGGGNSLNDLDLHLTEEDLPEASEYGIHTSFPSVAEQAEAVSANTNPLHIPQEEIDLVLTSDLNSQVDRSAIYAFCSETPSSEEMQEFLKNQYHGAEDSIVLPDGRFISVQALDSGLFLISDDSRGTVSWEAAASRIQHLIATNRYPTASAQEQDIQPESSAALAEGQTFTLSGGRYLVTSVSEAQVVLQDVEHPIFTTPMLRSVLDLLLKNEAQANKTTQPASLSKQTEADSNVPDESSSVSETDPIPEPLSEESTPQVTAKQPETLAARNYKFLSDYAPELMDGRLDYIRFESKSFEPLYIERLSKDTLAIAHTFTQNGDLMYDPEMTFLIDEEEQELRPLSFEQSDMQVYQRVSYSEDGRTCQDLQLAQQLNEFFQTWSQNLKWQEHTPVRGVKYRSSGDVEYTFGESRELIPEEEDYLDRPVQIGDVFELNGDRYVVRNIEGAGRYDSVSYDGADNPNIGGVLGAGYVRTLVDEFVEQTVNHSDEHDEQPTLEAPSEQPEASESVELPFRVGDYYEDAYGKGIITAVYPEQYEGRHRAVFSYADPNAEPGSRAAKGYSISSDVALDRVLKGAATLIPGSDYTPEPTAETEKEVTLFDFEYDPQPEPAPTPEAVPVNAAPNASEGRINFSISPEGEHYGGPKGRFRNNVEAIRLLKTLEAEDRLATAEEQKILSRYVGWGGLQQAFEPNNAQWANEYRELKELLTDKEHASAQGSVLTAFYTPPAVTEAIYTALSNFGFHRGNILDPCCGTGNFFGMLPAEMQDSKLYGVELDSISGRISRQLYQQANILIEGYEKTSLPDSFYDVAIGNVPFGSYKLHDRRYDKENFLIHDYFFAKTLDKVRPGGIIAFITSKGTMDKANDSVRKYIAQRADLLGAIRLPNNTFKENAGTEAVADILFLQKRSRPIVEEPYWVGLDRQYLGHDFENHRDKWGPEINAYFVDHPEMILGDMVEVSGPHGPEWTCVPKEGADLRTQLKEAVANIAGEIEVSFDELDEAEEARVTIPADPDVRNYSFTLVGGDVYFREDSLMYRVELNKTAEKRVKGMIELRDITRQLIDAQLRDAPDEEIFALQQNLNDSYDAFTKKHGIINSKANSNAFSDDSAYYLLCSLEHVDDEGNFLGKADMFYKRTVGKHVPITHTETAQEALAVSMGEKGRVDLDYICELCSQEKDDVLSALKGLVFPVPGREGEYEISSTYLSGNVRQKLATAKEAAKTDPQYEINAEYLENAIPEPLAPEDISVRLGATWIPQEDVSDFIHELLNFDEYYYLQSYKEKIRACYEPAVDSWAISNKNWDSRPIVVSTYGTSRVTAYKLIEDALNQKNTQVFDTVEGLDGIERRVLNTEETIAARDKQELIKDKFKEWIWSDPERADRLCKLYNERFNSIVPPVYDANMVVFHGMNPFISLDPHQKESIARILYGGNTQLAHEVGAGKTWTMVSAAMEGKYLGLCNKSLIVVPNHLVGQWASAIYDLYPSANVLASTKKDFETKNRKKFCSRIATGDYDIVVIGHSQFERIPLSFERQEATLQEQIADITDSIAEMRSNNAEGFTIKQMERTKKSLTAKLEKLQNSKKRDNVVTFEELGVDRLFVDESHEYKNLFLYTKMHNVAGISQTDSQKASDLFMKCRYIDEITGNKGNIHATGTPLSNTMAELYTAQRYLQYDLLQEMGLGSFDAWASTFGETVQSVELAPEGTGYRERTRFAQFFNIPELVAIYKQVADVRPADVLNLPVPDVEYHTDVVPASEEQKAEVQLLSERADAIRKREVTNKEDNMLCITNDGRKLALDQRLLNPELPDNPNSKANACVKNIMKYYREGEEEKLTQLVFCDLSTPTGTGFNVYQDLKDKLVAEGIPVEEIRFIHEANSDAQKEALFAKVRSGAVRILMGSTSKMGTGTNVQDRLIAGHDLDCPWRPSDLQQRAGRVVRRGNMNRKVHMHRYVTENTFDAYMYQLIEAKQRFASQIFTSKSPARVAADVDESVLNYSQIKALASGNPKIREKIELEIELSRLKTVENNYKREQRYLEFQIRSIPEQMAEISERLQGLEADLAAVQARPSRTEKGELFPVEVKGVIYEKQADAGMAILRAMNHLPEKDKWFDIGELRGFRILAKHPNGTVPQLSIAGERSYRVSYGDGHTGLTIRFNNVLDNGIQRNVESCKKELVQLERDLQSAKTEFAKPFPNAELIRQKRERLRELEFELSLDKTQAEKPVEGHDEKAPETERADSLADRIAAAERRSAEQQYIPARQAFRELES